MSASALTSWLPGWWRTRRATDERTGAATSATRPRLRLPPPFRLVGRDPGFAGGRVLRSRRAEPLAARPKDLTVCGGPDARRYRAARPRRDRRQSRRTRDD